MRFPRAIILTIFWFGLASCESGKDELRFVSPATTTIDTEIAVSLTELFDEGSPVTLELTEESLAGESALDALASGSADIALVSNYLPFRDDIATVMPLYSSVLHIAYRDGMDASSSTQLLRGASVYAGTDGSSSRLMFKRLINRLGLSENEFAYVADIQDSPDIIVVFAPIEPERLAAVSGYRLLSLGSPEEINTGSTIDAAVLLNPQFRHFVIPEGTYGDMTPEAIVTVAVDKVLVARSNLDRTTVYELINETLRLRPGMAAEFPGVFPALRGDFDASRSAFKLHAGTQTFLQRSEPSVYERYSGIAEVAVTLMIALISATFAGVRIFQVRRKTRIDAFYTETIAIKKSINEQSSPEERRLAIDTIESLQATAFDLLVDEKLAADESFRIFVTLSNDVLRDFRRHE